jgi:hypothetical protein
VIVSTLNHGEIEETSESLVCYNENVLIFHTTFTNNSKHTKNIEFVLEYKFGDDQGKLAENTRLYIRRPHPDDLEFGNVEGIRSLETNLDNRPPHILESLSVLYEIEQTLGEVHIGRYPNGKIKQTKQGGQFIHTIQLASGQGEQLWFWVILSDRKTYTHYPQFERVKELISEQKGGWQDFWNTSSVRIGDESLEAIRKSCLYTLRCNASNWTIPPGYLSTTWEGRTFHDEFYPFMGMISSNYQEIARRIPNYRLLTLPHAVIRSQGKGTFFGWEVTETGEESAPYGHWVDEQFRHGQISEECWRYYLHTGNLDDLQQFYPVIRGCAEWMIYDVLRRDKTGRLTTRIIADISEHVISAKNSIFVASATIRCLENACDASELLGLDESRRTRWKELSQELRQNLPVDKNKNVFRYAEDIDIPFETAHLGIVYPFSLDFHSDLVKNTFKGVWDVYQKNKLDATSQAVFSYNWIWAASRLATICFYLGEAEKGYEVLKQANNTVGPFMAPNEHFRADKGPYLPWLTSGAGAFVYAMNAMFVQVNEKEPAILFPALPTGLKEVEFKNLLTTFGVTASGKVQKGKITQLSVNSQRILNWEFRLPNNIAKTVHISSGLDISKPDENGLVKVSCVLREGETNLIQ